MPRTARIFFSSMPYHIISRGNNRDPVFQDEEDFEKYLEICRRYKDQYGFRLYHWVLMNSYIHLLMEAKENSSLSKIMQGINLAYTIWFKEGRKCQGNTIHRIEGTGLKELRSWPNGI